MEGARGTEGSKEERQTLEGALGHSVGAGHEGSMAFGLEDNPSQGPGPDLGPFGSSCLYQPSWLSPTPVLLFSKAIITS